MPPVAVAAVGIGLSVAGTAAAISQQNAQVSAQNASIDAQGLAARDQLSLAQDQFKASKQAAGHIKDRELQLNTAQRQTSELQVTAQVLQNELAKRQTEIQAFGIKNQAKQQAEAVLGAAYNQATQQHLASANEQQQLIDQSGTVDANTGKANANAGAQNRMIGNAEIANQQRGVLGLADATGAVGENTQIRDAAAKQGVSDATQQGTIGMGLANVTADYLGRTQGIQDQATASYQQFAHKDIRLQTQRNKKAIQASYKSGVAAGNMELLNQSVQTRNQLGVLNSQRPQGTGVLSYVQGAAGIVNQGMQSGLFTFPGTQAQLPYSTTKSGALDSLVAQGGTGGFNSTISQMPPSTYPSTITQMPPTTYPSTITQMPPGR